MPTERSSSEAIHHALETTFGGCGSSATRIDVLRNGDEIFPAMLDAIEAASVSIEFGTFVHWRGDVARRFADALARRAEAGVCVRVLIDAYGGHKMDDTLQAVMVDAGCRVAICNPWNWRRPWRNGHRTHRKTLVIDGNVGFTGGVGVASEWAGDANDPSEWRDTHFRFEGSVVNDLRATFVENWLDTTDALELVPSPSAGVSDTPNSLLSNPDWSGPVPYPHHDRVFRAGSDGRG